MKNHDATVRHENTEESIKNLMDTMKWTAKQAMDALKTPAKDQSKYATNL